MYTIFIRLFIVKTHSGENSHFTLKLFDSQKLFKCFIGPSIVKNKINKSKMIKLLLSNRFDFLHPLLVSPLDLNKMYLHLVSWYRNKTFKYTLWTATDTSLWCYEHNKSSHSVEFCFKRHKVYHRNLHSPLWSRGIHIMEFFQRFPFSLGISLLL